MLSRFNITAGLLLCLGINTAYAYSSNQGSHSCEKPIFSQFKPAVNKYTQSFSEFSFQTSANTVPTSINVNISVGTNKYHFTSKELDITTLNNGHLEVKGKMDRPVEHGFARLSVTAHIKPSCDVTDGILIRIY